MKLREQLIIFFSIIIIISIGVTSFLAISYTESGIIEAEVSKMKTQNQEIHGNIETLHSRASEDLVFALKNPKFIEYFELEETKAGNVYDENGVLQFTDKQLEIKKELEQWIYHFQNKFQVDETCLIDVSGQEHSRLVLNKIAPVDDLSSEETSAPFFEPSFRIQKDKVHVQYPYVSPDTERWVFAYTSPIELGDGAKPAIYHFEMPMKVFQDLITVDNGRMYVIDPEGHVMADSLNIISNEVISIDPDNQFPSFESVFGDNSLEVLEQMKSNENGEGVHIVDGEERYYVYEHLSTFDWILVYEEPTSEFLVGNKSISDLNYTITLISIGIAGFGVFGIVLISSRISKPICKLASQISSTKPHELVDIESTNNEVGVINNSLNQLMRKLAKYQDEINQKNEELTIQKQRLERLAKIGELASRLTHNLRTPITVIKSTTDFLKITSKDSLDSAALERLDRISSASENLEKQIEDVLAYVRDKPLDLKRISFNELIEFTLRNIEIPDSIEIISSKSEQTIHCDPDKLQVVFMNLITNAIDALDKKGKIHVDCVQNNHQNVITFKDDGSGIPEDVLPKIFDSLFTTKSSGTGLGLPYCKSVVEQHGGTITVSNNPTTFTISLPEKVEIDKK